MRIKATNVFLVLCLIFPAFSIAQKAAETSIRTILTYDDFIQGVRENHPLSKQAALQQQLGEAEVRSARGGFDPKTYAELSQKYFKDSQYYSLFEGGVKVPTWFGIEFMGGYEENDGVFLNPENNVPNNGLYFAGVKVPIGQGLFIDQRRATLRSAQVFANSTEQSRRMLLNDLLLEAASSYWKWFEAYHQQKVFEEAVEVALIRFRAVKQSAALGDVPSIDTLEAGIQVQDRQLKLQQAQLDYDNASAQLNVYLWDNGLIPLELADSTFPSDLNDIETTYADLALVQGFDTLVAQHPLLQLNQFEIDRLNIDRRLKAEMLKPTINLKYQPIVEGIGNEIANNFNENNYTWGVDFSFPILLRKERGALAKTKIKLQEKQFDLDNKTQDISYKARASINTWNTTKNQSDLYERTTQDYFGLLEGERQLFDTGESSLFLVNRREVSYINARVKLIELISKNQKAELKTLYNLGILAP